MGCTEMWCDLRIVGGRVSVRRHLALKCGHLRLKKRNGDVERNEKRSQ